MVGKSQSAASLVDIAEYIESVTPIKFYSFGKKSLCRSARKMHSSFTDNWLVSYTPFSCPLQDTHRSSTYSLGGWVELLWWVELRSHTLTHHYSSWYHCVYLLSNLKGVLEAIQPNVLYKMQVTDMQISHYNSWNTMFSIVLFNKLPPSSHPPLHWGNK